MTDIAKVGNLGKQVVGEVERAVVGKHDVQYEIVGIHFNVDVSEIMEEGIP